MPCIIWYKDHQSVSIIWTLDLRIYGPNFFFITRKIRRKESVIHYILEQGIRKHWKEKVMAENKRESEILELLYFTNIEGEGEAPL